MRGLIFRWTSATPAVTTGFLPGIALPVVPVLSAGFAGLPVTFPQSTGLMTPRRRSCHTENHIGNNTLGAVKKSACAVCFWMVKAVDKIRGDLLNLFTPEQWKTARGKEF